MSNKSIKFIHITYTHTHLHYFVIMKYVSTSVPNNLYQDSFRYIHLVCLPIFLFAQPFFFVKAIEVVVGWIFCTFFFVVVVNFLFFSIRRKHFFLLLEVFSAYTAGCRESIVIGVFGVLGAC